MSQAQIDRYEKLYPGTGCTDAQKEERQQRMEFKAEPGNHSRTGRNRGVVMSGEQLPDRLGERLARAAAYHASKDNR